MAELRYLFVGAGFSSAVLARELAERLNARCLVLDERSHIGGNCHTERDLATGVMVHTYGPHIFNTDKERTWAYVNRYGDFRPFINRVKAVTSKGVFSLPINLLTINQFFGKAMDPKEARAFLASLGDSSIGEPRNFEEQALKMLGRDLYEAFFYGYTKKQWGCEPVELPAAILNRLPVRFNYDDNYYNKRYQGIPAEGYTEVIRKLLDHQNIEVRLGKKYRPNKSEVTENFTHLFYSGAIDAFFNHSEGRLGYRTVNFERIDAEGDFQGNAVINYPSTDVPFTRIHEHKHFAPWETHSRTVVFREYSKETGPNDIPYYPKRLSADKELLTNYRLMAESLLSKGFPIPISFLGRLATYRYMDMEAVIGEALSFADLYIEHKLAGDKLPVFPNVENPAS